MIIIILLNLVIIYLLKKIVKNIEKEINIYLERIKHTMNIKGIQKNNGLNI